MLSDRGAARPGSQRSRTWSAESHVDRARPAPLPQPERAAVV